MKLETLSALRTPSGGQITPAGGLDIRANHEVQNLAHAFSMIASTRAVTLLPAYAKNYLHSSVASRPIKGDAPTVDLVVGYNKASASDILKLFLARVDNLTDLAQRSPA